MKYTLGFALAALLPLVAGSTTTNSSTTCYNLDGSQATGDVPCGSGTVVNCCNTNDICLSNGLCFLQGDRGMALSQGSCTDRNWSANCYAPCSRYTRQSRIPIIHVDYDDEDSKYCCGAVLTEDDRTSCKYGDGPFQIPRGAAVIGYAALSRNSSSDDESSDSDSDSNSESSSTTTSTSQVSPRLAIGVGIGLPLGLLAMGGVLWAVWERRRRQLRQSGEGSESGTTVSGLHHRYGPIPSPAPRSGGRESPGELGNRPHTEELMERVDESLLRHRLF
ncbi:hypothetical protein ARAM_005091 [Aspergillus rambellii]|uniref:Mid2 domain-containing protein n=1 Tax=Aspergillus rambellii TaxID=308745 RepID=A0A0F8VD41_9EURO|nr:hypothetical protein ARAM_005091 [Aspergillus rambellii]